MKKLALSLISVFIIGIVPAKSQDLKVTQFDFATSIENREPVGIDTAFAADVGDVFCFTRIAGVTDTTQIAHAWYYKEQEKARISLDVQSDDWRTWSSKKIIESWTGRWRVMIEDDEGNVLATKTFVIKNQ